jgi:hypothetical protein
VRALRDGLAAVLVICIGTRVAVELVTPVLPVLVTAFFILFVLTVAFGRRW